MARTARSKKRIVEEIVRKAVTKKAPPARRGTGSTMSASASKLAPLAALAPTASAKSAPKIEDGTTLSVGDFFRLINSIVDKVDEEEIEVSTGSRQGTPEIRLRSVNAHPDERAEIERVNRITTGRFKKKRRQFQALIASGVAFEVTSKNGYEVIVDRHPDFASDIIDAHHARERARIRSQTQAATRRYARSAQEAGQAAVEAIGNLQESLLSTLKVIPTQIRREVAKAVVAIPGQIEREIHASLLDEMKKRTPSLFKLLEEIEKDLAMKAATQDIRRRSERDLPSEEVGD